MADDRIGRASAFLASGTIVSRILGFVKAIVLAATIGVVGSASADAFAVANGLPNTVYVIVAGGVLSAVLVPQIVRASAHADGTSGRMPSGPGLPRGWPGHAGAPRSGTDPVTRHTPSVGHSEADGHPEVTVRSELLVAQTTSRCPA